MFSLDEKLKPWLVSKLEAAPFLLERYWDQLVMYLFAAPLQWLHTYHLLYSVAWAGAGVLHKSWLLFYLLLVFITWEAVRLLLLHVTKAVASGEGMISFLMGAAANGQELAKEACTQLKPLTNELLAQVQRAKEALVKLTARGTDAAVHQATATTDGNHSADDH